MPTPQVLAALVDGSLGSTTVNPPSAGWPSPGTGYVLNFVSEVTNLNAILAQSPPFEIELSTVVPTNTRTCVAHFSFRCKSQPDFPFSSGTTTNPSNTGASGSTPTDNTVPSNNGNGALSRFGAPVALVAAALVPALLA